MKKRNIKKTAVILLLSLIVINFPMTAIAEVNSEMDYCKNGLAVMPRLTYIVDAETDLDIESGVATVDCWVKGSVIDATKAKVIAELQLKSGNSWMAYGTWTSTQNDYEAFVYETKSVKAGQTYRVKATYTVWEGSQSETITVFGDEVTA